jgi:hypothetical protein
MCLRTSAWVVHPKFRALKYLRLAGLSAIQIEKEIPEVLPEKSVFHFNRKAVEWHEPAMSLGKLWRLVEKPPQFQLAGTCDAYTPNREKFFCC